MSAPDLDTPFRCEHWACVLAHKHCLRRQAEIYRKPGRNVKGKPFVVERAAYPYCASGECQQGAAIRAQFPDVHHEQHDPRSAPRLDIVRAVEEKTMPRGKPSAKRTCCESRGTRHLAACPGQVKAPAAREPAKGSASQGKRPKVRPPAHAASRALFDAQEATVEQLVETMEACREELAARKDLVVEQLRAIEQAISAGGAVLVATLRATGTTEGGA